MAQGVQLGGAQIKVTIDTNCCFAFQKKAHCAQKSIKHKCVVHLYEQLPSKPIRLLSLLSIIHKRLSNPPSWKSDKKEIRKNSVLRNISSRGQ